MSPYQSAWKLQVACRLEHRHLVIWDHVPRVKHVRRERRYKLEEQYLVLEAFHGGGLYCIAGRAREGGASPGAVRAARHDHLEVHCLNAVESLLSVAGAEDKGDSKSGSVTSNST